MELNTGVIVFIVYLMNQVGQIIAMSNDIVQFLTWVGLIVVGVVAFASVIARAEGVKVEESPLFPKFVKTAKVLLAVLVTAIFITTCTPNKNTVMQMGIAYGATEVLKSDAAKKVGEEIATVAGKTSAVVNKKLDKMLED